MQIAQEQEVEGGLSRQHLSDLAYTRLRQQIIQTHLRPGAPVSISDIASKFGVSPSPVRDALQRLHTERLIVRQRGSYFVRRLNEREIRDVFAVRRLFEEYALAISLPVLRDDPRVQGLFSEIEQILGDAPAESEEPAIAREVFDKIDDNLHFTLLVKSTKNTVLIESYARIAGLLALTRHLNRKTAPGLREHLGILSAILRGDPPAATESLTQHLEGSLELILAAFNEQTTDTGCERR